MGGTFDDVDYSASVWIKYASLWGWNGSDGCVVVSLSAYCWVLETQTTWSLFGGYGVLGFFSPRVQDMLLVWVGLTVR